MAKHASPGGNACGLDPLLVELVRHLARRAAERDYAAELRDAALFPPARPGGKA